MIALTLAEIAQVTGGSVVVPPASTPPRSSSTGPVVIDSREAGPGGLFVALVGEHVDGHDFAAGAVAARRGRRAGHPAGRGRARASSSPTSRTRFAALARAVRATALPDLTVVGHHRLVGQDQHQGPARPRCSRAAGADRRHRRLVQQRARRCRSPCCGSTADDPVPGARDGRPRHRPHRLPRPDRAARRSASCSTSAPRTSASSARARRSRGQGRARRGAAGRRASPCSTPTTRWSRAMAARTDGPGRRCSATAGDADVRAERRRGSTTAGRAVVHARHAGGERRRCTLRPASASTTSPTPLAAAAVALALGMPLADVAAALAAARPGQPRGGWRSSSAPTASPSSTTPTTPTPTRCAAALDARCERMGGGPPHLGGARRDARARRRVRRAARRGRRGSSVARGVDELVVVGAGAPRHWPRARAPRARHPAATAPACARCRTPTRADGAARRELARRRRRAGQVEP